MTALPSSPVSETNADTYNDQTYLDVIAGRRPPDPASYQRGREARASGKAFHEGPKGDTLEAVSWRIGWNERALERWNDLH